MVQSRITEMLSPNLLFGHVFSRVWDFPGAQWCFPFSSWYCDDLHSRGLSLATQQCTSSTMMCNSYHWPIWKRSTTHVFFMHLRRSQLRPEALCVGLSVSKSVYPSVCHIQPNVTVHPLVVNTVSWKRCEDFFFFIWHKHPLYSRMIWLECVAQRSRPMQHHTTRLVSSIPSIMTVSHKVRGIQPNCQLHWVCYCWLRLYIINEPVDVFNAHQKQSVSRLKIIKKADKQNLTSMDTIIVSIKTELLPGSRSSSQCTSITWHLTAERELCVTCLHSNVSAIPQ